MDELNNTKMLNFKFCPAISFGAECVDSRKFTGRRVQISREARTGQKAKSLLRWPV